MKLSGKNKELFDALSDLNKKAWKKKSLLSSPILSKSSDYGNMLENFRQEKEVRKPGKIKIYGKIVKYLLINLLHLLFMLFGLILIKLHKWKLPRLTAEADLSNNKEKTAKKTYIISTFALLTQIARNKIYEEKYLPLVAEKISKAGHIPFIYYNFYGSRKPWILNKSIAVLKGKAGLSNLHLLKLSDWFSLIKHIFVYLLDMHFLVGELKTTSKKLSPEYYIYHALIENLDSCTLIAEASRLSGIRLAQWMQEGTLISWFENQSINKAMYSGIREAEKTYNSKIRCIGAQLLIWPEELLNNHPDESEIKMGLMPDKVLVNGEYFLPRVKLEKCSYEIGPSLRYEKLFDFIEAKESEQVKGSEVWTDGAEASPDMPEANSEQKKSTDQHNLLDKLSSQKMSVTDQQDLLSKLSSQKISVTDQHNLLGKLSSQKMSVTDQHNLLSKLSSQKMSVNEKGKDKRIKVLALLSYHYAESLAVLDLLRAMDDEIFDIKLRFHPAANLQKDREKIPPSAKISAGKLYEELLVCELVIGAGSGSLAEAVALGIPVLSVPGKLNYLPDFGKEELWAELSDPNNIKKSIRGLIDFQGHLEYKDRLAKFRKMLFSKPTDELIIKSFELDT